MDRQEVIEHIEGYVQELAEKTLGDLPDDAEYKIALARDGRMWIDILSESYAYENDTSGPMMPPDGDPVFEQYVLVPLGKLYREAPQFYKKYYRAETRESGRHGGKIL
jgi:hypothetical protein